ncbi:hypothetical protein ADUPG1_013591 [Aduncisulcus paluster]|uniref:Protein kinase domain-containing protein n=1 Tax=Aduncisulcus paluster TaxID=2918883 RepID=A0ABQ5K415_9EUKA|nr:hypothetical protein ADUPG1_013591 [Aduncisulcus paluster]
MGSVGSSLSIKDDVVQCGTTIQPKFIHKGNDGYLPIPLDAPHIISPEFNTIKAIDRTKEEGDKKFDQSSNAQRMMTGNGNYQNFTHISIPFSSSSSMKGAYIRLTEEEIHSYPIKHTPSHLIFTFTSSRCEKISKKYEFTKFDSDYWYFLPIDLPDVVMCEVTGKARKKEHFVIESLVFFREETLEEIFVRESKEKPWAESPVVKAEFVQKADHEYKGRDFLPILCNDPSIIYPSISKVKGRDVNYCKESKEYDKSLIAQEILSGEYIVRKCLSHLSIPFPSPSPMKGAYICVHNQYSPPSLLFTFTDCDGKKTSKKYEFIEPKRLFEWHFLPIDLPNVVLCEIEGKGTWKAKKCRYFWISSLIFTLPEEIVATEGLSKEMKEIIEEEEESKESYGSTIRLLRCPHYWEEKDVSQEMIDAFREGVLPPIDCDSSSPRYLPDITSIVKGYRMFEFTFDEEDDNHADPVEFANCFVGYIPEKFRHSIDSSNEYKLVVHLKDLKTGEWIKWKECQSHDPKVQECFRYSAPIPVRKERDWRLSPPRWVGAYVGDRKKNRPLSTIPKVVFSPRDSFTLTSSSNISPRCIIGRGGFGEVQLVKVQGISCPCVLKKMLKVADSNVVRGCRNEFKMQRRLFNHPNCYHRIPRPLYILDLLDADMKGIYGFIMEYCAGFIMEFCAGGSVRDFARSWCDDGEYIKAKDVRDESEKKESEHDTTHIDPMTLNPVKVCSLCIGMIECLDDVFTAKRSLVHRDVKPNNFLVRVDPKDGDCTVVLGDLGFAQIHDSISSSIVCKSFSSSSFLTDLTLSTSSSPVGASSSTSSSSQSSYQSYAGTIVYSSFEGLKYGEQTQLGDAHSLGMSILALFLCKHPFIDHPALYKCTRESMEYVGIVIDLLKDDVLSTMLSRSPLFKSLMTIEGGKYEPVHECLNEVFQGLTKLDVKERMNVHEAREKVQSIKHLLPKIGKGWKYPDVDNMIKKFRSKYGIPE